MTSAVAVQLIITLGAVILAVVGTLALRRTRHVTAEVTLSVQAMEWAKQFEDRARNAETRAERAEARAERAEERITDCQARVERLETELRNHGLDLPPLPPQWRR